MLPAARRLARSLATAASSSSSSSPVLFDPAAAPGVATITINRPSSLNALSTSVARAVVAAARAADADAGIRAVVVTGSGDRAFAAGADVKELAGYDHERVSALGLGGIGGPMWTARRADTHAVPDPPPPPSSSFPSFPRPAPPASCPSGTLWPRFASPWWRPWTAWPWGAGARWR